MTQSHTRLATTLCALTALVATPLLCYCTFGHDSQLFQTILIFRFHNWQVVKNCLWFILEPLITRNDFYCYGFYKSLVERMKTHKDALNETDDAVNYVSYIL